MATVALKQPRYRSHQSFPRGRRSGAGGSGKSCEASLQEGAAGDEKSPATDATLWARAVKAKTTPASGWRKAFGAGAGSSGGGSGAEIPAARRHNRSTCGRQGPAGGVNPRLSVSLLLSEILLPSSSSSSLLLLHHRTKNTKNPLRGSGVSAHRASAEGECCGSLLVMLLVMVE